MLMKRKSITPTFDNSKDLLKSFIDFTEVAIVEYAKVKNI